MPPKGSERSQRRRACRCALSPLAAHALGLLARDIYDQLLKDLNGIEAVVFGDPPADPPAFWNWLYFMQSTAELSKRTDQIAPLAPGPRAALAATVPTILATVTAVKSLLGLFRTDTAECVCDPGFDPGLLRNAVLALNGLHCHWESFAADGEKGVVEPITCGLFNG